MEQSIQQKSSEGVLWFGMLGGAVAWVLHLLSIYATSEWGCSSRGLRHLFLGAMGTTWLLIGVTLAMAALAGTAAWQAHRKEQEARSHPASGDGEEAAHSRMSIAHLARVASSLFVLIILVESVPTFFFLQSCGVR
jgi:hypothetical protein